MKIPVVTLPQSLAFATDEWAHLPLFVREKRVRSDVVPVAHGTLWGWVAKGTFPRPICLSSGVSAWKRGDLKAWSEGTWKPEGGDVKNVPELSPGSNGAVKFLPGARKCDSDGSVTKRHSKPGEVGNGH